MCDFLFSLVFTCLCADPMAPKQSKFGNGDESPHSSPRQDPSAGSSTDFFTLDLDALLEKLAKMTLEEKEHLVSNMSDGLKDLHDKLRSVKKVVSAEKKELSKEDRDKKKKEAYEKVKSDKASLRGEMKTFTVNLGSLSVEIRVRLSTTIGALRKAIGSALNLSSKTTARLVLNLDGVVLASHPRKTLLGFHVRQGGTINANIAGMEGYAPYNEDAINAIFKNNDDDDAETSEEEGITNDEEPDDV